MDTKQASLRYMEAVTSELIWFELLILRENIHISPSQDCVSFTRKVREQDPTVEHPYKSYFLVN